MTHMAEVNQDALAQLNFSWPPDLRHTHDMMGSHTTTWWALVMLRIASSQDERLKHGHNKHHIPLLICAKLLLASHYVEHQA